MNIPDEAVEAAKNAYVAAIANKLIPSRHAAQIMLEAAAPFIAAHTLRDRAQSLRELSPTQDEMGVALWLESRADQLDPQ